VKLLAHKNIVPLFGPPCRVGAHASRLSVLLDQYCTQIDSECGEIVREPTTHNMRALCDRNGVFTRSSKCPANFQQMLYSKYACQCWTFAGSWLDRV